MVEECMFFDCERVGRVVGRLGITSGTPMDLIYCPQHRAKGRAIINRLINAVFDDKLSKFMSEQKYNLFESCEVPFCEDCGSKIFEYVQSQSKGLKELDTASEVYYG